MKKLYEVKVESVAYDTGYHDGYRNIAYTLTLEKAEEIRKTAIEEIKTHDGWWIDTGKNNDEPNVIVVELGEITE